MTDLTREQILAITGPFEHEQDLTIAAIIATGCTEAELMEARAWLDGDKPHAGTPANTRHEVVTQVFDLLRAEQPEWDEG